MNEYYWLSFFIIYFATLRWRPTITTVLREYLYIIMNSVGQRVLNFFLRENERSRWHTQYNRVYTILHNNIMLYVCMYVYVHMLMYMDTYIYIILYN